jgi:hypothetical protein
VAYVLRRHNRTYVMDKPLTATRLRADLYRILDEILETGVPVEIERKGRRLRIEPVKPEDRLARLRPIPGLLRDDPETYVHIDWSEHWNPDPT